MDFSHGRRRRGTTEVNLTPLLDIVFNLLIFFLITTTFVQNPGIEVELPKVSNAPEAGPSDPIIVAITAEGQYIHEGRVVTAAELSEQLASHWQKRQQQHTETAVIIQADAATPHGKVVEVMDLARKVGFEKLAIATEEAPR